MAQPWQQDAKKRLKERQERKRFKLPEGESTFRVLPNARGVDLAPYYEYRMHSEVGPNKRYLRCGKKINDEGDCWLCDTLIPKLAESKKPSSRAVAERLQPKDVLAVQILSLDPDRDKWVGPKLWEPPKTVADSLLGFFAMGKRNYTHPSKGYNFTVIRIGTDMQTRYKNLMPEDEPTAVDSVLLKKLKKFGEIVPKYDEANMKAVYYGHEQEDEAEAMEEALEGEESGEEETTTKKPGGKKPVGKKPHHEEPEEGEELTEESEETTEEEELLEGEEGEEAGEGEESDGSEEDVESLLGEEEEESAEEEGGEAGEEDEEPAEEEEEEAPPPRRPSRPTAGKKPPATRPSGKVGKPPVKPGKKPVRR